MSEILLPAIPGHRHRIMNGEPVCGCRFLSREQAHWEVTVYRNGESVVTIGANHLSGRDISTDDADAIETAARSLLGFIGRT